VEQLAFTQECSLRATLVFELEEQLRADASQQLGANVIVRTPYVSNAEAPMEIQMAQGIRTW
jgi:hypothetical protein